MKPTNFSRIIATSLITLFYFHSSMAQRVVRVTEPNAVNPAEVSVAINPKNPDNVLGASLQIGSSTGPRAGSYTYTSIDGGKTWKSVPTPNVENLVQGDDIVVFSHDGTAYHAHLSFTGIRVARPTRADNAISVNTSRDGGLTWTDGVPTVRHINSVTPFEDKPGMVVDNAPGSRNKGNLYVAWTRFDVYGSRNPEHKSQIYFSRSTDGGKSFSMPIRISDTGGDCVDSDNTVEGAVPAVGPNGEVYVVWAGPLGLVFDKSIDGGLTFGQDKKIADFPGGWDFDVEGISRANGMPVTGVDL
ncbi:MAG TPA: sialidase family protein, partial [Pyrinomonadaceae bacterium]